MKRQTHKDDYFPCGLYWDPNKYMHFNSILPFNLRSDSKLFPGTFLSQNNVCTRASVIFLPCFVKAPPVCFFCILSLYRYQESTGFLFKIFFFGKFLTCHFYFWGIVDQTPSFKPVIPLLVGCYSRFFNIIICSFPLLWNFFPWSAKSGDNGSI